MGFRSSRINEGVRIAPVEDEERRKDKKERQQMTYARPKRTSMKALIKDLGRQSGVSPVAIGFVEGSCGRGWFVVVGELVEQRFWFWREKCEIGF